MDVDLAGEKLWCRILKVNVGRVPLYLLDADIPENPPKLRNTTARLYGGDTEMRVRQEVLLGIGGCRALQALNIIPGVYHLNEGHAAFTLLERARQLVEEEGLSLEEATEMVTSQSILTIHTPVAAGNDVFERRLMEKYFGDFAKRLGMEFETLLGLGRKQPADRSEGFWMPGTGPEDDFQNQRSQQASRKGNQGHVARGLVQRGPRGCAHYAGHQWSDTSPHTFPVNWSGYTIGIWGWAGPRIPIMKRSGNAVEKIPDTELWRTHERCRTRLVYFARRRLAAQLKARNAPAQLWEAAEKVS